MGRRKRERKGRTAWTTGVRVFVLYEDYQPVRFHLARVASAWRGRKWRGGKKGERLSRKVGRGWRSEGRREGGFVPSWGGSRIEHASTHTLHSLGTRPLFMLDIIPLSKHTHFSRSLNVCSTRVGGGR